MKNYWARLKYLLLIHISGILFLPLFRVIFLIANHPFYTDVEGKAWYIFKSLLIGLRFDNVVACYHADTALCRSADLPVGLVPAGGDDGGERVFPGHVHHPPSPSRLPTSLISNTFSIT